MNVGMLLPVPDSGESKVECFVNMQLVRGAFMAAERAFESKGE